MKFVVWAPPVIRLYEKMTGKFEFIQSSFLHENDRQFCIFICTLFFLQVVFRSESIVMTRLIRALLTILRYDYMVLSNAYLFSACPERDSNMGPSRIAVVEDCKAITTQPPWMD